MTRDQIIALENVLRGATSSIQVAKRHVAEAFTEHSPYCETLFLNAVELQRELDVLLAHLASRSTQRIRTPMRMLQSLYVALEMEPAHRDTLLAELVPNMRAMISAHENQIR